MRAKVQAQSKARMLRTQGMSLRAIAAAVDASLSSVSVWVRGIPTPAPTASPEKGLPAKPPPLYRWCPRCAAVRPQASFNKSNGKWQGWCRPCFKEYFAERGARHREHVRRNKAERLTQGRAHLMAVLARSTCADCSTSDIDVLEFDHRDSKVAAVSALIAQAYSIRRLDEEIAKCDVVCANCHRRRTARTFDWRRAARDWRTADAPHAPRERRHIDYLYGVLEERGCVDCGERDLVVLDFDHTGPKTGLLIRLAREGAARARIDAELEQCEVRCGNCHRKRTIRQLGHYRGNMPPVGFEPTI